VSRLSGTYRTPDGVKEGIMNGKLTLTIQFDIESVHPDVFIDAINEEMHRIANDAGLDDNDNSINLNWAWEGDGVQS
jgi:hypothetical protein